MEERVLFVTGASSGIGAAVARLAVEAGWRVALAARRVDNLRSLANELGGDESAIPVPCDVTSPDDLDRAVTQTLTAFGRIDATLANAGVPGRRGFQGGDVELWRRIVLTNLFGTALTVRATLPAVCDSRGHVVLMGSQAGTEVLPGSLYSCTKRAVATLADSLRMEVSGTGVRVTLVEPGTVATEQYRRPPIPSLEAAQVAESVLYALGQPPGVDISTIRIRATDLPGNS
jgi:NADP-dependent 3-hydroxy acid dehydrogenase YdfG